MMDKEENLPYCVQSEIQNVRKFQILHLLKMKSLITYHIQVKDAQTEQFYTFLVFDIKENTQQKADHLKNCIEALNNLNNPSLLMIYNSFHEGSFFYIQAENVISSLGEFIRQKKDPLNTKEVMNIAVQILKGYSGIQSKNYSYSLYLDRIYVNQGGKIKLGVELNYQKVDSNNKDTLQMKPFHSKVSHYLQQYTKGDTEIKIGQFFTYDILSIGMCIYFILTKADINGLNTIMIESKQGMHKCIQKNIKDPRINSFLNQIFVNNLEKVPNSQNLLTFIKNNFNECEFSDINQNNNNHIQQNFQFQNQIEIVSKELNENELEIFLKQSKSSICMELVQNSITFLKEYSYTLIEPLGSGQYGIVFKGNDKNNKRFVAIKMQQVKNENDITKQLEESQKTKLINHPNVIKTFDSLNDHENGLFYIISEYCSQGNLQTLIESNKLSKEKIISIFKSILQGIVAIHEKQIIHCDLKPSNILISEEDVIKICDFGFSEKLDQNKTHISGYFGTFAYMPCEQVRGQIRFESDYFAVGAILCQLCGLNIFDVQNMIDLKKEKFPSVENHPNKNLIQVGYSMMKQGYKQRATIYEVLDQL